MRSRAITGPRGRLPYRASALALALAVGSLALAAAPAAADAWAELRALRSRLEAEPQAAEFRQEFLPAGFSSGDSETGRLTLALPGCLRWDYDEPFPKSYLLCGDTVWTWNPGESSGRTFTVDPEEERGLDLLRLGVERLAERYSAELVPAAAAGAATEIRLEPRGATTGIVSASLVLAPADGALAGLSYRDVEGNVTRFEFAEPRPLPAGEAALGPPAELTWIEE